MCLSRFGTEAGKPSRKSRQGLPIGELAAIWILVLFLLSGCGGGGGSMGSVNCICLDCSGLTGASYLDCLLQQPACCRTSSTSPGVPADTKAMTAFSFTSPAGNGVIDERAKTISVLVPYATNVTGLVATFTTTGTSVDVGNTSQFSGTTANDFTNPVTYTVYAADGSHATYTVTVTLDGFHPPANVYATAGNATVVLSWTPSSGATSYSIYYSTSPAITVTNYANMLTTSSTSQVISGLTNKIIYYFIVTATSGTQVTAASSPAASATPSAAATFNLWTWVSGADTSGQAGSYGTKGAPAATNVPGARGSAVSWSDSRGNLWLFGGYGFEEPLSIGYLNDLWKFDGTNWTWVSGSSSMNQAGAYGVKGTAAPANAPGARESAVSWIDGNGNLWLFGGYGYDAAASLGLLNDLWKFDGTSWTWVSGASTTGQPGVWGAKGTAAATNVPGARQSAASWMDGSGNLWLFGGSNDPSNAFQAGFLNDLWKFDGTSWTWVSGSDAGDQAGSYGAKGAPANVPGARWGTVTWVDAAGRLWLFGGFGIDASASVGFLDDLWMFDGTGWTWASGSKLAWQNAVYGTKGTAAAANVPGGRCDAVSWSDPSGGFWLFGGIGYNATQDSDELNDLWKFDGTNWTWMSGSSQFGQSGSYGTKGTAAAANVPGERYTAVSWMDRNGNLWLFGGSDRNDLWEYEP